MKQAIGNPVVAVGEFRGHVDIYKPVMFLVPIQAVKPLNTTLNRLPVYWHGCKSLCGDFKVGRKYRILFDSKTWEAFDAIEV